MNCKEINQMDIVDFLQVLGHQPVKIRGNDYWYHSPLREENTPSFKVNRKFNVWYDHGIQKGGRLVNLGTLLYDCTVAEVLQKIPSRIDSSFHQQNRPVRSGLQPVAGEKEKIVIVDVRSKISFLPLQHYLKHRQIPLSIAERFCNEIDFQLYDRKLTAIGFKNSAGGYELRSANFKGSSSPKEVTIIGKDQSREILVFEGFIDFLSYQTIHHRKLMLQPNLRPNFLILNSIGFIGRVRERLEKHPSISLYLDRDKKGMEVTKELTETNVKYRDASIRYKDHKDLNEYHMKENLQQNQSQRKGLRF